MLDTETTGTDPGGGDRIVEIGAVEILNFIPTGRSFHRYLNPQRAMSDGAFAVHGLSDAFLADKPAFHLVADELREFIGDAKLVIHNAAFDIGFLDAEFGRTGHPPFGMGRAVDTLHLARRKHPGASNSLDSLCTRYGISNAHRTKHGALLDAELLAEVYIELTGGRQADLGLVAAQGSAARLSATILAIDRPAHVVTSRLSEDERSAHAGFVAGLGPAAIWAEYIGAELPRGLGA